jgi:predicted DNA-binding transcriptional regulator YafY
VDGKMEMSFLTASLKGFSKFYLLFAEYAEVLEPIELKTLLRENLEAIAKKMR